MKNIWLSFKFIKPDEIGDLMTVEDFVGGILCGGFTDYDGYGYYATKDYYSPDLVVRPSDVKKNGVIMQFSHVLWFNR